MCINFLHHKQESLIELSQEHKRISQLQSIIPSIGSFTETQLSKLSLSGQETLNSVFGMLIFTCNRYANLLVDTKICHVAEVCYLYVQ